VAAAYQEPGRQPSALVADIKAYVSAPLHWDGRDWLYFAGALGAIGLSHHYDSQIRTHFTQDSPYYLNPKLNGFELQDAAPTLALLVGTWGYAQLTDDVSGNQEAWAMLEAGAFSGVTAFAGHYVVGREGPQETTDPDLWRHGGTSFPSLHTTVAFAVGTVMAESGSDDYRWLRRVLGYGVGIFTGYQRLKHNQHWLSDTVAGAALGAASARFAMKRRYPSQDETVLGGLSIEPTSSGGLMVSYRKEF